MWSNSFLANYSKLLVKYSDRVNTLTGGSILFGSYTAPSSSGIHISSPAWYFVIQSVFLPNMLRQENTLNTVDMMCQEWNPRVCDT